MLEISRGGKANDIAHHSATIAFVTESLEMIGSQ